MSENVIDGQAQAALLKATQVSRILNVSRAMAYRLMQIGEIRSVEIGAARRVRPEDLERYIAENMASENTEQ